MKLAVVMLDMPHWAEDRESGRCFEYLYGWLEGYALTWDPYVLAKLGEVPDLVGVAQARNGEYDLLVVGGRQVAEELCSEVEGEAPPGLWLDPPEHLLAGFAHAGRCRSMCERLSLTGSDDHFLPEWEYYWALEAGRDQSRVGEVGDRPLFVAERGRGVCACDFFRMVYTLQYRRPEPVKAAAATAYARALYAVLGEDPALVPVCSSDADSLRRDFHAFGAMLEIFKHLLREGQEICEALPEIETTVLEAARAYVAGEGELAQDLLAQAFRRLAAERERRFPLKIYMVDTPHCGIILPEGSMFEGEWPHYLDEFLKGFVPFLDNAGYKLSLETSVVSLQELLRRYPRYGDLARRLIGEGKLELVNGSFSGPLQQYSGIEAAYREFEIGQATLRALGLTIDSYVCQEFSFTPAFPGILRDLGYRTALHAIQNRGWCPEGEGLFLRWRGADGRSLPVIGHHHLNTIRRGSSTYIELPLAFVRAREEGLEELVVVLMQDQGYIHLRFEMIRAHRYAPVFVEYATVGQIMAARADEALPEQSFRMDEYYWEQPYWGPTSVDWLSGLERHYGYTQRLLGLEALAAAAETPVGNALASAWETALARESHDALLCSAGATGDFYRRSMPDYQGPRGGQWLAEVLVAREQSEAASLDRCEGEALAALGLRPEVGEEGRAAVLNPWPMERRYGGLILGAPGGLTLEGEGLRGGTWAGVGYVAGELNGSAWESVTLSATAADAPGRWTWEVSGGDEARVQLAQAELRLELVPRLAAGGTFRREELQTTEAGPLRRTEVRWAQTDGGTQLCVHLIQVSGSPLLHLEAETTGYDPGVVDKLQNALYLRLETGEDLQGHEAFISHFLQETRKTVISSPYLLVSRLPTGALSLINYGNIWHQVEERAVESALMFPLEREGRRRLTLGWNLADPVGAALEMNEPLHLVGGGTSGRAAGAVTLEGQGVRITSWQPGGILRLAETQGRAQPVSLSFGRALHSAEFLYERGRQEQAQVEGTEVRFNLGAYEVVALRVTME